MRGSVFRFEFRILAREFQSIDIFPGFAQLQAENWVFQNHLKQFCEMTMFTSKLWSIRDFLKYHKYLRKETRNERKI